MAEFRQYSTKNKVTTQANFDSLDKSTLSIGEQYSIVGPLEKDDLSTDIQNSLTKADNAFVAPTNDSTATAGQVLTKTAEGSEWKDAVSGDVTAAGNNTFTGNNTFNAQTVFNAELAVNTEQRSASYRGGKITADGYDLGFPQKSGILGVAEDDIIVIEKTITAFPTATSPSISIPFTTNEQNTIKNSIERIILKISTSNTYRILYPCMGSTILWDFATGIDSNVYYTLALTGGTGVFTYNHKMTVPVGNIYLSTSSTSPAGTFGGTWERIKDKFLLAAGDTYSAGATGGSADAVVVSHKHNGITWNDETPLTLDNNSSTTGNTYRIAYGRTSKTQAAINTPSVGVSGTGKNMPPYIAVYVWKRVS